MCGSIYVAAIRRTSLVFALLWGVLEFLGPPDSSISERHNMHLNCFDDLLLQPLLMEVVALTTLDCTES